LPNGANVTNTYDSVARLLTTKLLNSGSSVLDAESYAYNQASQRAAETNTAGDFRNYTYDNEGELKTAIGKESGGTINRWQEQLGYTYDGAGNLNSRTNNALIQTFNVNNLNELSTATRRGTLTVAGTTTTPATNVTVNGSSANLYADATFALGGFSLVDGTNTFTAVAKDSYGRGNTNTSNCYLPATNSYAYDLNGNMLTNGNKVMIWNQCRPIAIDSAANWGGFA
jgi:YD repeat-containing protein